MKTGSSTQFHEGEVGILTSGIAQLKENKRINI